MELLLFWLLFALGIVFTLIIYFDKVDLDMRYVFLTVLIGLILLSIQKFGISFKDMGFVRLSWLNLIIYSLVSFVGYVLIVTSDIRQMVNQRRVSHNKIFKYLPFYVLLSAPLQELNSRAYLLGVFRYFDWEPAIYYVLLSSFVFSFSHIFLKNLNLCVATFLMSLLWGTVYFYRPDFLMLTISHAFLGLSLLSDRNKKFEMV